MNKKILLLGGAGLVGQNLALRMSAKGYSNIIVLDKHHANLKIMKEIQPNIITEFADLSEQGDWRRHFEGAEVAVMLQAQIGGNDYEEFVRNNIDSTKLVLSVIKMYEIPYLILISSSVVESVAYDFYTNTKKIQEKLVLESGIPYSILRPTLMFGWFDRKHFGWLSRFMKKAPIFPIPGHGRYIRQPLYVGDFCNIMINCIENRTYSGIYNISGQDKIDYIDIIHTIKQATGSRTKIIHIPYTMFYVLLRIWGLVDNNPPFTTQQLAALVAKDEFEVIDWPNIFDISYTPFKKAIEETFNDPRYSRVILEF